MTRNDIIKRYPRASESFIRANLDAEDTRLRPAAGKSIKRVPLESFGESEEGIDKNIPSDRLGQMTWEQQKQARLKVAAINPSELFSAYQIARNIHVAAKQFGINGETARKKLIGAGYRLYNSNWTEEEKKQLSDYYLNTPPEKFSATQIAGVLNRTVDSIYIMAGRLGFSNDPKDKRPQPQEMYDKIGALNRIRLSNPKERKALSDSIKKWHSNNSHPKGMLGKHHTQEAIGKISDASKGRKRSRESVVLGMRTSIERHGTVAPNIRRGSWYAGWRTIGGVEKYFRSRWEANYARFLEFQKMQGLILSWQHEPETFWFDKVKRGCVSYLPDFKVTLINGEIEFHEVKGWMDAKSKTKIKRMAKYHPEIKLVIKDSAWFKANSKLKGIIRDWE